MPKKIINQCSCSCGATAKRDFAAEIPTQRVIGLTPVSHATTGEGSVSKDVEFLAGRFKRNPDGSIDKNHRPFRDTGEVDKFMNGANDLGDPVINQATGKPLRRADGSVVRQGAKLFKYGANSTPSRHTVRRDRPAVPDGWTDTSDSYLSRANGVTQYKPVANAAKWHSPERRSR